MARRAGDDRHPARPVRPEPPGRPITARPGRRPSPPRPPMSGFLRHRLPPPSVRPEPPADRPDRSSDPAAVPARARPPTGGGVVSVGSRPAGPADGHVGPGRGAVPAGSRPSSGSTAADPRTRRDHAAPVRPAHPGRPVGSDGLRSTTPTRAQVPRPARERSRAAQRESRIGSAASAIPIPGVESTDPGTRSRPSRGGKPVMASGNGRPQGRCPILGCVQRRKRRFKGFFVEFINTISTKCCVIRRQCNRLKPLTRRDVTYIICR